MKRHKHDYQSRHEVLNLDFSCVLDNVTNYCATPETSLNYKQPKYSKFRKVLRDDGTELDIWKA